MRYEPLWALASIWLWTATGAAREAAATAAGSGSHSDPPHDADTSSSKARSADVEKVHVAEDGDPKDTVLVTDPTTPVLPDRDFIPERAYQLQWEVDVPLFAIGGALALGREMRTSNSSAPAYCTTVPTGCDEQDLNSIDRPFAGRYDERWSDSTDWVVLALLSAPWPMLWYDNTFLNTFNDVTVIYESGLTAIALSGLATLSASRARPFVYGDAAPESVRNSPNGSLSFVSGHTTMAFALSTSTFWTIYRRQGSTPYAWVTLAAGTTAASAVAIGRVMAGKHFPTDVLTGAAVGASVGTLLPALHDAPVAVVPSVGRRDVKLRLSVTL